MQKTLLSALLLLAIPALAAPTSNSNVTVSDAWFRSLPGTLPAAGYFTARNSGTTPLSITGAKSASCSLLMMHKSSASGGMSSMAMVSSVDVPAGGSAQFSPTGLHLMCSGPKFKPGDKADVTLTLSDGSTLPVSFQVRDAKGQ